jgi:hypothetical protein
VERLQAAVILTLISNLRLGLRAIRTDAHEQYNHRLEEDRFLVKLAANLLDDPSIFIITAIACIFSPFVLRRM